jgi:hypothetical protein
VSLFRFLVVALVVALAADFEGVTGHEFSASPLSRVGVLKGVV